MSIDRKEKSQKYKFLCYSILIGITILLLIHSAFSFCQSDEPNYSSLLYRIYLGDALIRDEWHPTQFYSPVIYPFYLVFHIFSPDNTGIILFFRILYTLFSFAVSICLFNNLITDYGCFPAMFGAIACLLYSRANINGCSYYKIAFLSVILTLIFTKKSRAEDNRKLLFFSGICTAGSVFCNPYLILFALFNFLIVLFTYSGKKRKNAAFLYIGGFIISAALYGFFLLSRANLKELVKSMLYIINEPSHIKVISDIWRNLKKQSYYLLIPNSTVILAATSVIMVFLALKYNKRHPLFFSIYSILTILFTARTIQNVSDGICFGITYPLTLAFFPLAVYLFFSKQRDFAIYMYAAGLVNCISWFLGSNTLLDAMTIGFTICSIAGILMLFRCTTTSAKSMTKTDMPYIIPAAGLSLIVLVIFFCTRIFGIYRDAPLEKLNTQLEKGPAAGLRTTPEHSLEYNSIYDTIQEIYKDYPVETVMFAESLPWGYLCTNWKIGSFSTWGQGFEHGWLEPYFRTHQNKIPSLIFLLEASSGSYESAPFNSHKFHQTGNNDLPEGWFYDQLLSDAVVILNNDYLTVFQAEK